MIIKFGMDLIKCFKYRSKKKKKKSRNKVIFNKNAIKFFFTYTQIKKIDT